MARAERVERVQAAVRLVWSKHGFLIDGQIAEANTPDAGTCSADREMNRCPRRIHSDSLIKPLHFGATGICIGGNGGSSVGAEAGTMSRRSSGSMALGYVMFEQCGENGKRQRVGVVVAVQYGADIRQRTPDRFQPRDQCIFGNRRDISGSCSVAADELRHAPLPAPDRAAVPLTKPMAARRAWSRDSRQIRLTTLVSSVRRMSA